MWTTTDLADFSYISFFALFEKCLQNVLRFCRTFLDSFFPAPWKWVAIYIKIKRKSTVACKWHKVATTENIVE